MVAGDICIDWLVFGVPARDPVEVDGRMPANWELYPSTRMVARLGGALLLSRMVEAATGAEVASRRLEGLEVIPPEEVVHSIIELGRFAYSADKKDKKNLVYRVSRFGGYAGPSEGLPSLTPVSDDDADAEIVILDDVGNGFRDRPDAWPAALQAEGKRPIVIHKMSRPLAGGELWETLRTGHADRLVVVVSANDLREEGLKISRRLSWERTGTDFAWQIVSSRRHVPLASCTNLVVRFGTDGAIHYTRGDGRVESRLYFDPAVAENGFGDDCPGEMSGFTSAFVAALAARIAGEGLPGVREGIRDGIRSSRRLFRAGFGRSASDLDYPGAEIFEPAVASDPPIADAVVPELAGRGQADPTFWSILKDLRDVRLEEVAYGIVRNRETEVLRSVPMAQFGYLTTVDRTEIESLRSIRNLMLEYLANPSPSRPLSIAVFGPPGAGKSFAVTQVATSIAGDHVKKLEFNIAQFTSPSDLGRAFHQVRDARLAGKVPLVFLDEFDSAFNGKLGWLKYFLTPMQDGEFREGDVVHPIGKAIFVFAGGTSFTFADFSRAKAGESEQSKQEFKDAKGPDFASRLRGYVNVLGPDPTGDDDKFYGIRRAMLLRSQIERKAKHLLDQRGCARIDEGVLRAFLKIPRYKHGARSMEAIIDMSMLAGRRSFEQASLPPAEQLELHVDAQLFSQLVVRDVLLGAAREKLARAIHEKFRRDQAGTRPADDPSMASWEELAEGLRESNLQQADAIPEKLRRIRCGFATVVGRDPIHIEFTPDEAETLAEMEHERWVSERLRAGWSLGRERDVGRRISPYLVPWGDLPDDVKEYDFNAMRGMPEFMADAGFEIYRPD